MVEIARDRSTPRIQQLSFFLRNRLGALREALAKLQEEQVRISAISILEAADHAVIRLVVDRPFTAKTALESFGYDVVETELLGVPMPEEKEFGIQKVLTCLLMAEVNIHYIYSLLDRHDDRPILALNVENAEWAAEVLEKAGLSLVGQDEIK
jgi:hypothetical protein